MRELLLLPTSPEAWRSRQTVAGISPCSRSRSRRPRTARPTALERGESTAPTTKPHVSIEPGSGPRNPDENVQSVRTIRRQPPIVAAATTIGDPRHLPLRRIRSFRRRSGENILCDHCTAPRKSLIAYMSDILVRLNREAHPPE